jgi:hypothetical protein
MEDRGNEDEIPAEPHDYSADLALRECVPVGGPCALDRRCYGPESKRNSIWRTVAKSIRPASRRSFPCANSTR